MDYRYRARRIAGARHTALHKVIWLVPVQDLTTAGMPSAVIGTFAIRAIKELVSLGWSFNLAESL